MTCRPYGQDSAQVQGIGVLYERQPQLLSCMHLRSWGRTNLSFLDSVDAVKRALRIHQASFTNRSVLSYGLFFREDLAGDIPVRQLLLSKRQTR
jgi:hypothetical protein